jgi:hypothetical protein
VEPLERSFQIAFTLVHDGKTRTMRQGFARTIIGCLPGAQAMTRLVDAILPALAVFALASAAVALPPERPAPNQPAPSEPPAQPDEATLRRIATAATPPPLAAARTKLNAVLSQRLRAAAATALSPVPAARPVPPPVALAPCTRRRSLAFAANRTATARSRPTTISASRAARSARRRQRHHRRARLARARGPDARPGLRVG